MDGKMKITLSDKILLFLIHYTKFRGERQTPIDITQEGIASNIGITRSVIQKVIKSLIKDGYVEENFAHISGIKRGRKVYTLTNEGIIKSRKISDKLSKI